MTLVNLRMCNSWAVRPRQNLILIPAKLSFNWNYTALYQIGETRTSRENEMSTKCVHARA